MQTSANVKPRLWQENENCIWFTDQKLQCAICGRHADRVLELCPKDNTEGIYACFDHKKQCFNDAMNYIFGDSDENYDEDYVWARSITYKPIFKTQKKTTEPVGLSKRYAVLKRDGFQCVACGATGKDARLEVDHIIPRSKGGSNDMSNLQTLCFECNRGKRDSL